MTKQHCLPADLTLQIAGIAILAVAIAVTGKELAEPGVVVAVLRR